MNNTALIPSFTFSSVIIFAFTQYVWVVVITKAVKYSRKNGKITHFFALRH
jgi:hypothetical protein